MHRRYVRRAEWILCVVGKCDTPVFLYFLHIFSIFALKTQQNILLEILPFHPIFLPEKSKNM
jgi:hypothetical protein